MSVNTPPNPNVSTFNNLYWIVADEALTYAEASKKFLKFPTAQGTETLLTTNVNGVLTVNNQDVIITDGTTTNTIDKNGYTTKNSVQNLTHYLNFSDSASTGVGAIQKSANFVVNPSTGTLSASGVITATGGLTIGGANNITLGSGATAPISGQLGYYQTISLIAWPLTANGNITDPTTGTSLPAGTWLISFCLLFGGSYAPNNFIYLGNPGTEYKTFPIQALTTGATVATVNGCMIQKSTTAYIPNFKVGTSNGLTLNSNAYFNATRIA